MAEDDDLTPAQRERFQQIRELFDRAIQYARDELAAIHGQAICEGYEDAIRGDLDRARIAWCRLEEKVRRIRDGAST
jgi:hypothetical protein